MSDYLYFAAFVQLAVGCGLLLAWRADRAQAFARWLGLAYVVNSTWVLAYWLHFHTDWPLTGLFLWALQVGAAQALSLVGVRQLGGHADPPLRCVLLGLLLVLLLFVLGWFDLQMAVSAAALVNLVGTLVMVPILWREAVAEKVAASMLVLIALVLFLPPWTNFEHLTQHHMVISGARLVAGIALLYASLRRGEIERFRLLGRISRLARESHHGIAVLSQDKLVYANACMVNVLEAAAGAALPKPVRQLDPDMVNFGEVMYRIGGMGAGEQASLIWTQPWRSPGGGERSLRITAWRTEWDDQDAVQLVLTDETELNRQARQLLHLATHHEVTGLPNLAFMREHFPEWMRQHSAQGRHGAVLMINLDNFRTINDALGYERGDEFLRLVGARLQAHLGEGDLLAHQSSDEFLVLHSHDADQVDLPALSRTLLALLRQPFSLDGIQVHSSASIGIALYPYHGTSFSTLQLRAGVAMRQSKDAGRNMARLFDDGMNAERLDDILLLTDLNTAVQERRLELYLQPIVRGDNGEISGGEALMRWKHPTRGFVSPARFIPLAERTGLIIDIGAWLIDEACALSRRWHDTPGLERLLLSINISAMQFARGDIDDVLAAAMERHGVTADRLEIEVTESALINDPEQFVAKLSRLSDMGFELAIDDFGTGYSNLAYLQRFKVNRLKIDQSFVQDLLHSAQARAIVVAVIQMARSLNLWTTAEGIEDVQTRDELVHLGCDNLQGYLIARPMPVDAFERFVAAQREPRSALSLHT